MKLPMGNVTLPLHVLSVREFVEPLVRTGHLSRSTNMGGEDNALMGGMAAHARIQNHHRENTPGYAAEVPLKQIVEADGWLVQISGKLDSYFAAEEPPVVEEIKSCTSPAVLMDILRNNPQHPYILQAQMYAWMIWRRDGIVPQCRLLVVSRFSSAEHLFPLEFCPEQMEKFVVSQAEAWSRKLQANQQRLELRRELAPRLTFPFAKTRHGQGLFMEKVEDTIRRKRHLLAQAPTGLGKTAAALFPALKQALAHDLRVFYVTPRNSQHLLALEFVASLQRQAAELRSVAITAKEKACLKESMICHPDYCEYSRNYYDKLPLCLAKAQQHSCWDAPTLQALAAEHEVCPFELSLDLSNTADVVVCDYNYVFSPTAMLQRHFGEERTSDPLLLIDEVHQLHSRGMSYFSPVIRKGELVKSRERMRGKNSNLKRSLKSRFSGLWKKCMACFEEHVPDDPTKRTTVTLKAENFFALEAALGGLASSLLEDEPLASPDEPILELFRLWLDFCNVLRAASDDFVFTWQPEQEALCITCCDASFHLQERMSLCHAVIGFSATVKPMPFYSVLTGFDAEKLDCCELQSPFPETNRKVLIIPQISTAWKDRETNYRKIADVVSRIAPLRPGNYFVFFPSFDFLDKVAALICLEGFRIVRQVPNMKSLDVAGLLAELEEGCPPTIILAVQGGSLAEGIDLPGEKLIGAFVVGPSLPVFELERELIRKNYDRKFKAGFSFAYVYPAMTRVVQAAGRVIRTQTDKGLIVLMDKRFLQQEYAAAMPSDWFQNSPQELVSSSILQDVKSFWERVQDEDHK